MDVALKVDVDTRAGMAEGVPRLRQMLNDRGIQATFFITFGPDNSGKAIRRIFRPGFLRKMMRTRAVRMYGWKTMLYGTLLPPPLVGAAFPELLRGLAADGHEIGLHAWDHVRWHDTLRRMPLETVAAEFGKGVAAYTQIFGEPPGACAAPGWTLTADSLRVQDSQGMLYHSDTRGTCPFFPSLDRYSGRTVQIPTTLPTLDEIMGTPELHDTPPEEWLLARFTPERLNVFTLHAEAEGMGNAAFFARLLDSLLARSARFHRLREIALGFRISDFGFRISDLGTRPTAGGSMSDIPKSELRNPKSEIEAPRCAIVQGSVPGRAGIVACQGAVEGRASEVEQVVA